MRDLPVVVRVSFLFHHTVSNSCDSVCEVPGDRKQLGVIAREQKIHDLVLMLTKGSSLGFRSSVPDVNVSVLITRGDFGAVVAACHASYTFAVSSYYLLFS